MRGRSILIPLAVVCLVFGAVVWAARQPRELGYVANPFSGSGEVKASAGKIDELIKRRWRDATIDPALPADPLQVLRRLSLALHGTIPSLEEVRQFEADAGPDRIVRWTRRMLEDKRFHDYFAERLARSLVGTDTAPFLIFRRDRFKDWLAGELRNNTPFDELVRRVISEQGLWTGTPATNFVTAAVVDNDVDENKLAGRSVRAFLGQRMDCAQCHNHPFASWKQQDFEGIAAFFGQARVTLGGVEDKTREDKGPIEYMVEDRMTLQPRVIGPRVPFHPEWLPQAETRRQQLAAWITHPDNRRFERAIVNRVWGYLFGRPRHTPVADLPDPPQPGDEDVLDVAGRDFRAHGCDLRRLILVLASTRAFQLDSASGAADGEQLDALQKEGAVFPMSRLRPEQIIGALLQGMSVQTIDQNSHLVFRLLRFAREKDFVNEYGDPGDAELDDQAATITQALQRMNGTLSRDILRGNPLNATGRISGMAGTDERCVETCFLVALSRRPSEAERAALMPELAGKTGENRSRAVEDILWALFNTEEFSWNH